MGSRPLIRFGTERFKATEAANLVRGACSTYAACKADMLLKGEGRRADHIVGGRWCRV
jgi:hypothetical protein